MRTRFVVAVVLASLLASVVVSAQARRRDAVTSNNCTVVGTWMHQDEQNSWTGVVSPGPNATSGQLALEWIVFDPSLGGKFAAAVRVTDVQGVWGKVNEHEYKFTWLSYAMSSADKVVYVLRATGMGTMPTCDTFEIAGKLELFMPTQNVWTDTPLMTLNVTEFATRMPLVIAQ